MRRVIASTLVLLAVGALAACGSGEGDGSRTLTWFIAKQPGGALEVIADRCSSRSDGRYRIELEFLPSQADQQREQLVRRLGAEDDTIDIVGADVVWTGEFANAGWLRPVPRERRATLTRGVFDSVLQTATFEDRLYAAPLWSNTQLLWYRKDRVDRAPTTWDELLDEADRLGKEGVVAVQADRYEGLVVLAGALINSAGTRVLDGPDRIGLERAPTVRALEILARLARSHGAPDIDTSDEDTSSKSFEAGVATFELNYPFVFPAAKENAPEVYEQMAAAKYPRVDASRPSNPPLGGFNLGVSSFAKDPDRAWDAIECLVSERNQLEVTKLEGLPPVRPDLFDRQPVRDAYPGFADTVRESIEDAEPRPSESPAYQDVSLAIQRALHPLTKLDPAKAYDDLREKVQQAIDREGLL
jgi:multiple sugar transport system substrate-binding protein